MVEHPIKIIPKKKNSIKFFIFLVTIKKFLDYVDNLIFI